VRGPRGVDFLGMPREIPREIETTDSPAGWPAAVRAVASLAIVLHLLGVILPPLAGPPPASLLANQAIQPFRPYVGLLYLGHGYRFFAPDPGPGHSLRFAVIQRDGGIVEGSIPDADRDRPRLLYHRRFMIPEKLAALVPPPDAPAQIRREAKRDWLPLVRAIAGELLRRHDGLTASIDLVEHDLPTPADMLEAKRAGEGGEYLGDDLVIPLGTFAVQVESDRPTLPGGGSPR